MPDLEPIESEYFNWLCSKVVRVGMSTPSLSHWNLLRELQNTEFVWVVPMDDNRAEDGRELRMEFVREKGIHPEPHWLDIGCSVLEMLIAFSKRASFATGRSPRKWFWTFIDNLGLHDFNDAVEDRYSRVSEILDRLIWRTYEYDGTGGMFPLKHPREDQRKVEIWHQFCDYLVDN